jgi:glycosyltransferase involved in cell wall biosynthesis
MTEKHIALAEWHWIGHNPTYFAHFVVALEELGADVLAICPAPEEARQTVAKLRGERGLGPSRDGQTTYRQMVIQARRFQGIRPARIGAIDWTLRHFRSIERVAKEWQAESGKRLDLLFYACIYDWDFDWFQLAQPFLSLPWSGLYLHSTSLRLPGLANAHTGRVPSPAKTFHGPLCRGAAVLDEGIASQLAAITGKPVVIFPDLTDERFPTEPSGRMLEVRLRAFAAGRPVIGLFGYLVRSKGLLPLAQASRHPRMADRCFAFGGEVWWPNFSREEHRTMADVLAKGANTWNHLVRIEEEQLNPLLSACDVLYAAYLDFPNSSNMLTKAALLKKPVIVSDGHLMAERVRRFRMGEVIPQGDVDALAEAIAKITGDLGAWVAENQPRWPDYLREHSFERLKESFREVLAKV